jgi:hypothetical protein
VSCSSSSRRSSSSSVSAAPAARTVWVRRARLAQARLVSRPAARPASAA